MSEGSITPKKAHPDAEDLEALTKNELLIRLKEQDLYIKQLESKKLKLDKDDDLDAGDRLKQQQKEASRRENTLVHRLTTKEQELQDFMNQIAEVKQAQTQGTSQLRSMLLDPAVNIVFQRMAKEMDEAQEKLKQTQNELSAWKFTPDSQTGKRLMARCQMLLQENEELGKTIASGRTAKLEGEIALQKTLVTEMKNNQSELDEFLGDLEEDVEGMQTMIYVLQQQLKESKEQISALEDENARLRSGDTSGGTFKTISPKQRDKTEKTIKTEDRNNSENYSNNAFTEHTNTDYTPMETGYYVNEKTDSDLEAEYNYEGLYENEDKYQEELEAQQAASTGDNQYEYEENGYKNYDEEYENRADYKNYSENDVYQTSNEHEQMETDDTHHDNHSDRTKPEEGDHQVVNHKNKQEPSHVDTDIAEVTNRTESSHGHTAESNTKQSQSPVNCSTRQQQPNSTGEARIGEADQTKHSNSTDSESKDTRLVHSTDDSSRNSKDSKQISTTVKERTPEREQIPSPKPSKVSPVQINSPKAMTPEKDAKSNSDHSSVVSPPKDKSPIRPKSSPIRMTRSQDKDKGIQENVKLTSNLTEDSSLSKKEKEREPVLQMFLNGVTSTVDDIEDL